MSGTADGMDVRTRLASLVVIGDRDFLFHRDHEVFEQISGKSRLTPGQLRQWIDVIETRHAWCLANGIKFRLVIIPEKHIVYNDLLPDVTISEERPAMQILNGLSEAVRCDCFYPVEELKLGRSEKETFYRTDTHFTWFGGYLVYRKLFDSLRDELPSLLPVSIEQVQYAPRVYVGDLGVRLEPEHEEIEEVISHINAPSFAKIFDNKAVSRGAMAIYESVKPTSIQSCVLFRDSFSKYMIPHIIASVRRLTVLSSMSMYYDLVRAERPDVVIFQMIERFFLTGERDLNGNNIMPADLSGHSIEEFANISLADLPRSAL